MFQRERSLAAPATGVNHCEDVLSGRAGEVQRLMSEGAEPRGPKRERPSDTDS